MILLHLFQIILALFGVYCHLQAGSAGDEHKQSEGYGLAWLDLDISFVTQVRTFKKQYLS